MSLQLNQQQLQKLTHEDTEIRLRALEEVNKRFTRSLAHNELLAFRPEQMVKQLIRWFGLQPLQEPEMVLRLLIQLLGSSYAPAIFRKISKVRLTIELEKVRQRLLEQPAAIALVAEAQSLLRQAESEEDTTSGTTTTCTAATVASDNLQPVASADMTVYTVHDYERPWSRPSVNDVTTMKLLADLLSNNFANAKELNSALEHLQITMQDYPAEFLLQTPHLYQKLLELHERMAAAGCQHTLMHTTLHKYLCQLGTRLQQRHQVMHYAKMDKALSEQTAQTQLKPGVALQTALTRCLAQLAPLLTEVHAEHAELIELLAQLLQLYRHLGCCVPLSALQAIAELAQQLLDFYQHTQQTLNVARLKYLLLAELLQDMVVHNYKILGVTDELRMGLGLLQPLRWDYAWHKCQSARHAALMELFAQCFGQESANREVLQSHGAAYALAVAQLMEATRLPPRKLLSQQADICSVFESLASVSLVKMLCAAISDCNAHYIDEPLLRQQAESLLKHLLCSRNERLQQAAYKQLRAQVLRQFHCLMSGEAFAVGKSNLQLIKAQIFGVPLSVELVELIISHAASESGNGAPLAEYGLDCLCLLLKSESLLHADFARILELLEALLPLLIALSSKHEEMLELLLQLHHPDNSCLAFLPLLRGNICFMFHPLAHVRHEAITRLVYMLRCSDQQCTLLPAMEHIRDLLLDDIVLVQPARDFQQIFSDRMPATLELQQTMFKLLELLESTGIEPLIRKTTLMQLNIMLQSWPAAMQFCEYEAYIFPLKALHNSLLRHMATDYNDAAIPAVGMLAKLFCTSDSFRQEMTSTVEVHLLLLRALFHFRHDLQLKQDASLCLYQLIYARFIQVDETGVRLPSLAGNLHVPISYRPQSEAKTTSSNTLHTLVADYFGGNAQAAQRYWRMHIAQSLNGATGDAQIAQMAALDIAHELKLTKHDQLLLAATQLDVQFARYLKAASNATDHKSLLKIVSVLTLYLLGLRSQVATKDAETLQRLLSKYLQLQPGNASDYELFESLLALCTRCIAFGLPAIITGLGDALQADGNHSFIVLLRDSDTSLRLYQQLADCLSSLLAAQSIWPSTNAMQLWFGSFYTQLCQLSREALGQRDLPRVRCLLRVLQQLSGRPLALSDRQLQQQCRQMLRLSCNLRVHTQTGSQLQRDCLRIVCQLHAQMEEPAAAFRFSSNVLQFLSGLCGHSDAQVRSLAWIILANIAEAYVADDCPAEEGSGALLAELKFLPGGFLACCLSTLLDEYEIMLVRQLAGRVYALLFKDTPVPDTLALLERHSFLKSAHAALGSAVLEDVLPMSEAHERLDACEVIACYVHICVELLQLQPEWAAQLTGHAFVHKLYELLKQPPTSPFSLGYRRLCAQICELYTRCYPSAFDFVQRTLCRDPVLLMCYARLLDELLADEKTDLDLLVPYVKLLLVLAKDDTAYAYICQQLAQQPAVLLNLCVRALPLQQINTPLQRYTLSLLTLLLIKAQTHAGVAQQRNDLLQVLETKTARQDAQRWQGSNETVTETDNKENDMSTLNRLLGKLQIEQRSHNSKDTSSKQALPGISSAAVLIYMCLDRLFTHLYPMRSCKFTQSPTAAQQQVCEALSVVLKVSASAQQAAVNVRLLPRLMQFVQNFHDDFNSTAATYVRRHGEHKGQVIIRNLSLLFQLIFHWHSSHSAVITDELQAVQLARLFSQVWPWLAHSAQLRLLVFNACAFLTEHSFVVCRQLATPLNASGAHIILELVLKHVSSETLSVRAASADTLPIIARGLRIMMNCCACAEGRLALLKLHVLDIFDGLLSGNQSTRQLKAKPELLNAWLRFWELFARYEQGGRACHLHLLLATVQRMPPRNTTRVLCLRILRNMCFVATNRNQLIATGVLLETLYGIVVEPMPNLLAAHEDADDDDDVIVVENMDSGDVDRPFRVGGGAASNTCKSSATVANAKNCEEQRLTVVCLWKLFGSGAKYKAMLRGTKLAKHLRILREQLASIEAERPQTLRRFAYASELIDELDQLFDAIQN